jgi:iron(III) transport system ATP-binding protein
MADLRCQDVAKSYGARSVLSDVDLFVPEGTLTAILGASGSGKTTLLRVVVGFIPADRGTVSIGGRVVADAGRLHVSADKRGIGYVAQEGALFPHLSVAANVAFGLPRAERKGSRVGEMLELVGLDRAYAPRGPQELSGGEQRRVALARALAPRPPLVLLDEPFSGLDAALRTETREAVLNALAGAGTTAVLVTHDQGEALSMGREVAVLRAGRLAQTATPATLYHAPVDLDLARFVGDAVVVPGDARAGAVDCALGHLELRGDAVAGPVQVMIRPEQIRIAGGTGPGANGTWATVVDHTYFGPDTVVRMRLEDGTGSAISAKTFDAVPAAGERVYVAVAGPVAVYPRAGAATTEAADPSGESSVDAVVAES